MNIYRIKLSNRDEIIIPEDKLTALMASKEQIVKINFNNKEWELINKAHIVNAKIDHEETRSLAHKNISSSVPAIVPSDNFSMEKMIEARKNLENMGIIKR